MNKDQRKYLTDWVDKGFNQEQDAIEARRYERPMLNNYLVALAMRGELEIKPGNEIAAYVQKRVLELGKDDALVSFEEGESNRRWDRKKGRYVYSSGPPEGRHEVTLDAEQIFEIPQEYLDRLEAWEENEKAIAADLERLEGVRDTVLLKVNIGSDKALESVIAQADSLASLDLVNRQLTAGNGAEPKGELKG